MFVVSGLTSTLKCRDIVLCTFASSPMVCVALKWLCVACAVHDPNTAHRDAAQ